MNNLINVFNSDFCEINSEVLDKNQCFLKENINANLCTMTHVDTVEIMHITNV